MKLESQITNNHSSLIDNQSKRRSTTVENSLQITPFYAKQSQFWKCQKQHKHFCNNEIRKNGQLVIQTKQTQFKSNKAKNKPNSNPIKPKQTQFKPNFPFPTFRMPCILWGTAHRKPLSLRMFKLNICSNKLEWINFVKNSCIPGMEDNASEQIKSLLGVPK